LDVSSLILNRLSLYLRCLRSLQEQGVHRVSSQQLADQFHLSAPLIRKDLAQFGEFGIRGTGYDIEHLIDRLHSALGLDQQHPLLVVGMGRLGTALARYLGFNDATFRVVAVLDNDPAKVGQEVGGLTIGHTEELEQIVREFGVEIGVLTVPAEAAQPAYDALVDAGVQAVLNFAPVRLQLRPGLPSKSVDFRIHLEELVYLLLSKEG
jgi:redox-sensing transcriptional repressor